MHIESATRDQLESWETELSQAFNQFKIRGLKLDLTRGKPAADQLDLSDEIDGILNGNYHSIDGTDTRNYGGLKGLQELRELGANILGVSPAEVIAGGNSSLTYMYFSVLFANMYGPGDTPAWSADKETKFLCPVPGYDRHFSICESLGIEMIPVPMNEHGPDMDIVEKLVANHNVKGMWCVPKYSNPTGTTYSDDTVERIAKLGMIAATNFRVFWDNAYAVHNLNDTHDALSPIMEACRSHNSEDLVIQFTSTSKITHAGSGVCFMAGSEVNLNSFCQHLGMAMIGPDKVNQLRHTKMFPNRAALDAHMQNHLQQLAPRFNCVEKHLSANFENSDSCTWTRPNGGYFVSIDVREGLAKRVVELAAHAGVKLTPAGATFPYGKDLHDTNIRLAPSFPTLEEIEPAMDIVCCCIKLASVQQALKNR